MKTLYFDCSWGISGDRILGALTEIVDDRDYLIDELGKLHPDGYRISISKCLKNGISATCVKVTGEPDEHHPHQLYDFHDCSELINESGLSPFAKELALRIILRLAGAERKVCGKCPDDIGYEGSLDAKAVFEIAGTAILIDRIRPDRILSSVLNDGYGLAACSRGTFSIPLPVTGEILAGAGVKLCQIGINAELVTPVGAAVIAELARDFIPMPAMAVNKIGWGAGTKELSVPDLLKVYLGREEEEEDFAVMETNIDDCSGELLGYIMELLMQQGALDVFYTPVFMKKNRPAYLLTVTCKKGDMEKLQDIIFRETTTIGIRYRFEQRTKLEREIIYCDTPYGRIRAKKVKRNEDSYVYPEYESLKEAAASAGIPLKELYRMKLSDSMIER